MSLYDFAYCPDFDNEIDKLSKLAEDEDWGKNNGVLKNYVSHYFQKALKDNNIEYLNDDACCIDTALLTREYRDEIYMYFEKNPNMKLGRKWVLKGFYEGSNKALFKFSSLPDIVRFFSKIDDIIYNDKIRLVIDKNHVVEENRDRFPKKLHNLDNRDLAGKVEIAYNIAEKMIKRNYKVAVPQYYNGKIQFLIPLFIQYKEEPDIVLVVAKVNKVYSGTTCLTMEQAYNNARLIVKPESSWLRPSSSNDEIES